MLSLKLSKKNKVLDIIKHIQTLYKRSPDLIEKKPLKYPSTPDAYELRLIDDYEEFYTPFYEIAPLEYNETVGEFESLAFVENKSFKPPTQP
jgi:hypothetical protein